MPFSTDQFLHVFEMYNGAIWPAPVLAYVLGLAALVLVAYRTAWADRLVCAILALAWLWMGVVYHMVYFSPLSKAAFAFGALFSLQAGIFLADGAVRDRIAFRPRLDVRGLVGGLLILYGMLIYPLLGVVLGHTYPRAPMFGVAPCPTVIFTLGLLLWTAGGKLPRYVLVIPFVWSIIGYTAAVKLGIREDIGLLIAGICTVALLLANRPQDEEATATPEAGGAAEDVE